MTTPATQLYPSKTTAWMRAIALIFFISLTTTACAMDKTPFDKEQWRIEGNKGPELTQRWKQSEALQAVIKLGMSREEILELLGPPDDSRVVNGAHFDIYDIGITSYSIDMASYEFEYRNGKLLRFQLARE